MRLRLGLQPRREGNTRLYFFYFFGIFFHMYDKQHFGDLVSVSFLWHLKIKRYRPGSRSQRPAGAVGCQSTVFKFKFRFKLLSPPFKPELKLKLFKVYSRPGGPGPRRARDMPGRGPELERVCVLRPTTRTLPPSWTLFLNKSLSPSLSLSLARAVRVSESSLSHWQGPAAARAPAPGPRVTRSVQFTHFILKTPDYGTPPSA